MQCFYKAAFAGPPTRVFTGVVIGTYVIGVIKLIHPHKEA